MCLTGSETAGGFGYWRNWGVQANCWGDCRVWELTEITACVCACVPKGGKWETDDPGAVTRQTEATYWTDPHCTYLCI